MSAILEQAFGSGTVDLYADVLCVAREANNAQLRKAFYKQALKYHPDKNPSDEAKVKFQAISWTYNLLKNAERRADYDQTGSLPSEDFDDDDDDDGSKPNGWKDYFDTIFGKLSAGDIDSFAMKYKMSDEEEKDVLDNYQKFKGNLVKMLEFVMLSEERDVKRWMEDYIQPAIKAGKVTNYADAITRSMKKVDKELAKQKKEQEEEASDREHPPGEGTATESEDSDNRASTKKSRTSSKKTPQKATPKKGRPTKAKAKSKKASQDDLVAAIRNKNKGGNPFAALGARYGVSMEDDDPLDDDAFAKVQSKLGKKKRTKK